MATDPTLSADEVAAYVNWLITAELGKGKELPLPPPHLSTSYRSKSLHRSKAQASPTAFQPEMLDCRSGDEASHTFEEVDSEGDVASADRVVAEFCTVVLGPGMAGATDGELEDGEVFGLAPDNAAHWQRNRSISPPQPKPPREATTLELGATATTCTSTGRRHPHIYAACKVGEKAGEKASAEVLLKARTRCPTLWHQPCSNPPWASRASRASRTGGGHSRHSGTEMVAESESAATPRLRSHKPLRRASRSMANRADRFSGFDWADAHEEGVLIEVIDSGNRTEFC